jgi:hypothetical protein
MMCPSLNPLKALNDILEYLDRRSPPTTVPFGGLEGQSFHEKAGHRQLAEPLSPPEAIDNQSALGQCRPRYRPDLDQLRKLSESVDCSVGWLIRRAVKFWLGSADANGLMGPNKDGR